MNLPLSIEPVFVDELIVKRDCNPDDSEGPTSAGPFVVNREFERLSVSDRRAPRDTRDVEFEVPGRLIERDADAVRSDSILGLFRRGVKL